MRRKAHAGTVMIELLVVTVMLGVTATALYLAIIHGYHALTQSSIRARANAVANLEIEQLRSRSFDSLPAPYQGVLLSTAGSNPINLAQQLPDGSASLAIQYHNPPDNTIKQATVTVNWRDDQRNQQLIYTTLIGQSGINQ